MEGTRSKIFLVDDNMSTLTIGKRMLKDAYEVYPLPSAAKLFEALRNTRPDLILLDILMPVMDGYETIRLLKADPSLRDIPVIFLTAQSDEESEMKGLQLGAIDYVTKPFAAALLIRRIQNHLLICAQQKSLKDYNDNLQKMVLSKTAQIVDLQNAVLSTVAELVEFRDTTTGCHIVRTQAYLKLLIDKLLEADLYTDEISAWNLDLLLPSAQLHDVGKITISDVILNKPGKLTTDEFHLMQEHVPNGVLAIQKIKQHTHQQDFLQYATIIAATHHEKWDGSGYPNHLSGTDIPLVGRLMAISDVYDALISVRPYKRAFTTDEAARIILEGRGSHFDPVLVEIFAQIADQFAEIATRYQDLSDDMPFSVLSGNMPSAAFSA